MVDYMLLDGKMLSNKIKNELKAEFAKLDPKPKLVVILVGDDPASKLYIQSKQKACEEVGVISETILLDSTITEEQLVLEIERLNNDPTVHGILVQLPLPKHLNETLIINTISDKKDVDGFHIYNKGRLINNLETIVPATPLGVLTLLKEYNIEIKGKHAVVIGRSNIVGRPMAALLLNHDATVTICHRYTENLKQYTLMADIIVCAVGKPNLITADMVKEGAVIIDVGINRLGKKVVGDVDFENVKDKASAITPVPGGVGPMTIAMLLSNLLKCYQNQ
ncbi:MAG: bifunctional 5,10-methylenetetrahydrofolate dehydrogenase/5,10-methenyltetrahydrofolate cyclohydrolase [Acholeplasmataceae bacterium]|nr:bifunctional 5,10-methylenetetrahydrofolate dehydrogenase/5,10-methenyltetrahydrofolate cyclohydrolase [Acholeplasmataceae bacterium]